MMGDVSAPATRQTSEGMTGSPKEAADMNDLTQPTEVYARRYLALLITIHTDCVCSKVPAIAHGFALDVLSLDDAIRDLEDCQQR
jgi:hypothetical protein